MAQELSTLAALVGVAISALISWVLSKSAAANEIKKMRLEAKKTYESRLIEERLKCYPPLFALLSQFIKDIQFGSVSREMVESLFAAVNRWDSQNAILLSHFAAERCYRFRHYLAETRSDANLFSEEGLDKLHKNTAEVEFALRSDIGIYGISNEGDPDLRRVDSYALLEKVRQDFKDVERDLKESQQSRSES